MKKNKLKNWISSLNLFTQYSSESDIVIKNSFNRIVITKLDNTNNHVCLFKDLESCPNIYRNITDVELKLLICNTFFS